MTTKISKYMLAAMAALVTLMATSAAYAQAASPEVAKAENARWYALAAALGLGICGIRWRARQGKAAAAALDGIARNPGASDKLFTR